MLSLAAALEKSGSQPQPGGVAMSRFNLARAMSGAGAVSVMAACARPAAREPAPEAPSALAVVPLPADVRPGRAAFRIPDGPLLIVVDTSRPALGELAAWVSELIAAEAGAQPVVELPGRRRDRIMVLELADLGSGAGPEQYQLVVTPVGISIQAAAPAGLFYGFQTLRQLVRRRSDGRYEVPSVTIIDRPRFRWRGMHLDVGRHFFPVSFVKRYLDLMARYKLNTFHWHLTEDQGWRIQIRRYPRLTEVGSCRRETTGDGVRYCGYYTQDQIREVVEYARRRFITVVPEIEMPGHSLAALASYPELACTEGPFEVGTRWGVFEDVLCPGEATFAFLENVLTEVMELFPGRYVHIGGDEVPKRRWRESPLAQEVMRRENLSSEEELQSWFIRRIERFLLAGGRRLVGWDEILEGGLAPEATVMSWRGTAGGIAAARQGHDVVMSPTSHLYFDYYQGDPRSEPRAIGGFLPLERVYSFEPVPPELSAEEARHILGAQGNVWTEYIPTASHVEYMALPRMLALAEVVWSPASARSWPSFSARLPAELARLDALGVNYRRPGPVSPPPGP
jgi:hexosaminidase